MALQRPRIGSLTDLLEIDGLRDHVLSWLHVKDVGRLASTCKAVRLAVEEEDDAGGTKLRAVNLSLTFSLRPPFPGENESTDDEEEAAAVPGALDDEENKVHAVVVPSNLSPVLNRISIHKLQGLTIAVKQMSQDDLDNKVYTQRRNGGINVDFNTALGAVHSLLGKGLTSLAIYFSYMLPVPIYAARVDAANFSHFANALAQLPRLENFMITQTLGLLRTSFATERARNGRARIPFPALRRLLVTGIMPLEQIERDSLVYRACVDHQNVRAVSIGDRSTSGSSDQQLLHDATAETNTRSSKEKGRTFGKLVQFSCRTTATSALAVGGGSAPQPAREFWSSAVSPKTRSLAVALEPDSIRGNGVERSAEQERAMWDSPGLWHGAVNVEHLTTSSFPTRTARSHFPRLWSLVLDGTHFNATGPACREGFASCFDGFAQNIKRLEFRSLRLSQLEIGILIGRVHDGNFLPCLLPQYRDALRKATEKAAQNRSSARALCLSAKPACSRGQAYPYAPRSVVLRADCD